MKNKKLNKIKNNKKIQDNGITLVALVITIIIIIILATVAISFAFGSNGLINRAEDASEMYANDTAYTEGSITNVESYINDILIGDSGEEDKPEDTKEIFSDIYETTELYTDSEGNTAWIPQGFAVGVSEGINKVNNGLVITDDIGENHYSTGNQFVWITVDDTSLAEMYNTTTPETAPDLSLAKSHLAEESTTTKLYSKLRIVGNDYTAGAPNSTLVREPDILINNGVGDATVGNDARGINLIKNTFEYTESTDAEVLKHFAQDIVNEYYDVFESIKKYDGFYIGRYELTGTVAEPTVRRNETVLTNQNWYSFKKLCNDVVNTDYAQTTMIYGNQWDRTAEWLVETGEKNESEINQDSSSWGNYIRNQVEGAGEPQKSGYSDIWSANNIYDLAGNYAEWTQEANGDNARNTRGGLYSMGADTSEMIAVTIRGGINYPYAKSSNRTTRLILYVK